ncbi:MAG: hypothetical protein GY711_12455 [bacterium]|nr:hypothetical protein [bacterium]
MARLLVLLAAFLACLHAASFLDSGPIDDDFIVYRYARSLIEGDGLVYNTGERFEGFTVPLWLFWIAGGLRLGLDPVAVSQTTSILGAGLAVLLIGLAWARRFPGSTLPAPAWIVAVTPAFAFHGAAGLGTTLLAALLCTWLVLYEAAERRGRTAWGAGLALALACLLRQECALFAVPFLVFEARRGRSVAALPAFVVLVGWTAFRLVYFGRLLPTTYDVKKLPLLVDLAYGARYLGVATITTGVGLYALGATSVLHPRVGARSALFAALTGALAHLAYVVYVGGDFVLFARFFVPVLPIFVYLACVGLRTLLPRALAVGALVVALAAPQWTQLDLASESRAYTRASHDFNEKRWIALGHLFQDELAQETTLALSPIGAIGWYSRLRVIDILGLTNASAIGIEPNLESTRMKGHHRSNASFVLDALPDVVLLGNGVRDPATGRPSVSAWERELVMHPRFQNGYIQMMLPVPEGDPVDVFVRKGTQPPRNAVPR